MVSRRRVTPVIPPTPTELTMPHIMNGIQSIPQNVLITSNPFIRSGQVSRIMETANMAIRTMVLDSYSTNADQIVTEENALMDQENFMRLRRAVTEAARRNRFR
jgi:hypothetical protein